MNRTTNPYCKESVLSIYFGNNFAYLARSISCNQKNVLAPERFGIKQEERGTLKEGSKRRPNAEKAGSLSRRSWICREIILFLGPLCKALQSDRVGESIHLHSVFRKQKMKQRRPGDNEWFQTTWKKCIKNMGAAAQDKKSSLILSPHKHQGSGISFQQIKPHRDAWSFLRQLDYQD